MSEDFVARHAPVTPDAVAAPAESRIHAIDVARGISLLGILLMNIVAFGSHFSSYGDPTAAGTPSSLDLRIFEINFVLFEGKMRAIFSLLFGAGIVLFTMREHRNGVGTASDLYFRRNLWLIVFGVVHAFVLLWPGDILYTYGITALFLYAFRNARPKLLLSMAALCIAVNLFFVTGRYSDFTKKQREAAAADSVVAAGGTLTIKQMQAKGAWEQMRAGAKPTAEELAEHNGRMRGNWPSVAGTVIPVNFKVQSTFFYFSLFWDAAAMMLIGMVLLRWGVLTLERSTPFYLTMAAVSYAIGIPLGLWVLGVREASGFALDSSLIAEWGTYEVRRLSVVLGHIAVIMLAARATRLAFITSPLAAVGRMAFSNYIMQTLICTFIFYGYGLAKFGTMSRAGLYAVVLGVWMVQLVVSPLWLRYYRFGPLEWAWRSLTYWRRQPMRRQGGAEERVSPAAA